MSYLLLGVMMEVMETAGGGLGSLGVVGSLSPSFQPAWALTHSPAPGTPEGGSGARQEVFSHRSLLRWPTDSPREPPKPVKMPAGRFPQDACDSKTCLG